MPGRPSKLCEFCFQFLGFDLWRKNRRRKRRKIFFGGEEKQRRKRRKIFGEGKYIFGGGEGKGGKYLEKNIYVVEEKKKEEHLSEKENVTMDGHTEL